MIRFNQKEKIRELLSVIDDVTISINSSIADSYPIIYIKSGEMITNEVIDNETYDDIYVYFISIILPIDDREGVVQFNEELMDNLEEEVVTILRHRNTRNQALLWQDLRVTEVSSLNNNEEILIGSNTIKKDIRVEVDTIINY